MVIGTFLFAGLTTAFELVPPWLIKMLIDDVIQAGKTQLLSLVFRSLQRLSSCEYCAPQSESS